MKPTPRLIWPRDLARSLVDDALKSGHSAVRLKSNREARLFRWALYHIIRVEKIRDLLTISVADRIVRLDKRKIEIQVVEDWKKAVGEADS